MRGEPADALTRHCLDLPSRERRQNSCSHSMNSSAGSARVSFTICFVIKLTCFIIQIALLDEYLVALTAASTLEPGREMIKRSTRALQHLTVANCEAPFKRVATHTTSHRGLHTEQSLQATYFSLERAAKILSRSDSAEDAAGRTCTADYANL